MREKSCGVTEPMSSSQKLFRSGGGFKEVLEIGSAYEGWADNHEERVDEALRWLSFRHDLSGV